MEDESILPGGHSLAAAYPNPFNPATNIEYSLSRTARVTLKVRDALGRQVAVLVDEVQSAGSHEAMWIADAGTPAGTYFYTLETSEGAVTRSMTLQRRYRAPACNPKS